MAALKITDTELEVLKVLWNNGASMIREITDSLYPDGGVAQYATVQKLLDRLRSKLCVKRIRCGRGHIYSAIVQRTDLISTSLEETATKLCGGSFTPLLTHLIDSRRLSREEIGTLKDLVQQLENES